MRPKMLRLCSAGIAGLLLAGCASVGPDMQEMGQAFSQIPQPEKEKCEVPFGDAVVHAEGRENCGKLLAMAEADRAARRAEEVCSGMGRPGGQVSNEENERHAVWYANCVDQVMDGSVQIAQAQALGQQGGRNDKSRKSTAQELMVKYAIADKQLAVQREGNYLQAGTSIFSLGIGEWGSVKRSEDLYNAFETALQEAGVTRITQSNDVSDCGEGANCTVDVGDFNYVTGKRHNVVTGPGSSGIQDSRQPIVQGTNEPDSSFDPSTSNEQNASAPNNPINNPAIAGPQRKDNVGLFR